MLGGVLAWGACAGSPAGGPDSVDAAGTRAEPRARTTVHQPVQEVDGYGPEILLPTADTTDDEVARVGDHVLRKSHIYDRLLLVSPDASLEVVDLLILDILVAETARRHGITVDPARVEAFAQTEVDRLREQVEIQFDGKVGFEEYARSTFQMSVDEHLQLTRTRVAQLFYHGYAIRFPAMLEDRVQVRMISNQDRKVLEDVVDRVSRGADFATLARRYSEDNTTRRDGGLLTPFGADFPHPIAEPAMQLQKGEMSQIIETDVGGSPRYILVYCLERFARREVTFEAVRQELDEDLVRHPVTRLEREAFTLRYRPELESRKTGERRRQ